MYHGENFCSSAPLCLTKKKKKNLVSIQWKKLHFFSVELVSVSWQTGARFDM